MSSPLENQPKGYSRRQILGGIALATAAGTGLLLALEDSQNPNISPCQQKSIDQIRDKAKQIAVEIRSSRPIPIAYKPAVEMLKSQATLFQSNLSDKERFNDAVSLAIEGTIRNLSLFNNQEGNNLTPEQLNNLAIVSRYSRGMFKETEITREELTSYSTERIGYLLFLITGYSDKIVQREAAECGAVPTPINPSGS